MVTLERTINQGTEMRDPSLYSIKDLAVNLGKPEYVVQDKIRKNNTLPAIEEYGEVVAFPRFYENALLLARASPGFYGPRGLRPSLVTLKNILELSDLSPGIRVHLKKHLGGFNNILLHELEITASNPGEAPKEVKFSNSDIREGIYIPPEIDKPTAQALGIIYGNGNLGNNTDLVLSSKKTNNDFYQHIVRRIFEEAFNFSRNRDIKTPERINPEFVNKKSITLRMTYSSNALRTYLANDINFPKNRTERIEMGLSEKINNMDKTLQDEFLKYFFACAATFHRQDGTIIIYDISEPILKDLELMINSRIKTPVKTRPEGKRNTYVLFIPRFPAMELYLLGFLSENPRIKDEAETYLSTKLGRKARSFLRKNYKDLFPIPAGERLPAAETIVSFPPPPKETALVA